jgi:type IV pilus assembly protein PilM
MPVARRAGKAPVGLNIEPGFVAAVQAGSGTVAVERAAVALLPTAVVSDGEVVDAHTLSEVLHRLFAENKLGKQVRIGVANQRIVVRRIDLPPLTDAKEIESAIRFQAPEHIPMPIEQAVLAHHSLGIVQTEDGPRTRVVLVAARRDMIDKVLAATRMAGLKPVGIDLSAFAMIRALHRPGIEGATLYVSAGGVTNLAVAVGTACVFTRVVPYGTESMAAQLAERRGLTLEHAHGWLKHVGLVDTLEEIEGEQEIVNEARSVLSDGLMRIADDVRNSLDFYRMQEGGSEIEHASLTGPAAAIPGFCDALSEAVSLPFEPGVVAEGRPGGLGGIEAAQLVVAAGLTVDEVPA